MVFSLGELVNPGGGAGGGGAGIRGRREAGGFMLGVFLVFFFVSFSVAFVVRSWAPPRRFWSPTWPQLGPISEPCWSDFGAFLGVVLLSSFQIHWEAILIDFHRFSTPRRHKKIEKQWFFNIFAFLPCSLLRPFLDRLWADFGAQNRPKINPESVLRAKKQKTQTC